ncbi:MAG TPA: serine hydrolase domain-containing protein [Burkholderiales bacterium]|nr:serine hydrolase domain-containing protein [Burkholderiales bacterium]
MHTTFRLLLAILVLPAFGALAAPLPETTPETAGLSSDRLAHLTSTLSAAIESGELPGAVIMIARDGKLVYSQSLGWQDKPGGVAMRDDSIFRIYSMTKPIVSVGAMMLVEQGKLSLDEPVSKYIPAFSDMKVSVEPSDATENAAPTIVDADRPITIQDLLRHTSGLTYQSTGTPTEVKRRYKQANIFSQHWTLEDFANTLATLPLQYQPGTTWEYGHSTDILGRVIEVVTSMPLDRYLEQYIFAPLRMENSAFRVAPAKHGRIAEPIPDKYTGKTPMLIDVRDRVTFLAGGHGLTSTAGDYLRFSQMLLNGGELDGVRLLGPKTVRYIASNHLNETISKGHYYIPGPGYGFGLGFATRLEYGQSNWPASVGEFYWGGYAGTYFWIDPEERLVVSYMSVEPLRRQHYRVLLRNLVYQAIME